MAQERQNQVSPTPMIEEARIHFLKAISEGTPIYPYYARHVEEVERWTRKILPLFPEADIEIVSLAVQLHDIGHADGKYWEDHAAKSEDKTIRFLSERNYPTDKIQKVAHCVRAHRCRDVQPTTVEAHVLAVADSASHMTDFVYIVMLGQEHLPKKDVLEKLERDYQDIQWLPGQLRREIEPLYDAWKRLIEVFPK